MKTLKSLLIVACIALMSACGAKHDENSSNSTTAEDSTAGPGVGAAPDNSRDAHLPDSVINKADSTRLKQ